jgi:transcriptional regulator with XRE-family HTH domain
LPLTPREVEALRILGEQLHRARVARGWSQRGLERMSYVDQTVISRLENGRMTSLRLVRVAALVAALGSAFRIERPGD